MVRWRIIKCFISSLLITAQTTKPHTEIHCNTLQHTVVDGLRRVLSNVVSELHASSTCYSKDARRRITKTGGADQWVLKQRECSGFARGNKVTSSSLGYPLSVFKNSTLKVLLSAAAHRNTLQHAATCCNTLQRVQTRKGACRVSLDKTARL